jgi:hypothetical protein
VGWEGQATSAGARPDESALFAEATNNGQPSDRLMLVFLVELALQLLFCFEVRALGGGLVSSTPE